MDTIVSHKESIKSTTKGTKVTVTLSTTAAIESSRPVDLPPAEVRRAIRRTVHLTQSAVGEIVGVTGQMVGLWEMGRNEPTGQRRTRYAELLRACLEAETS